MEKKNIQNKKETSTKKETSKKIDFSKLGAMVDIILFKDKKEYSVTNENAEILVNKRAAKLK